MDKKVKILDKKDVYNKLIFRIEEVRLRFQLYSEKMSDEVLRINFIRGDSAAAVVHDTEADTIILVEQFRYPTYGKESGWLLELPAGVVRGQEANDPQKTIQREIKEEIGYDVGSFKPISTFYVSPGGTSERIHLYYVAATPKSKTGDGGGVIGEGEDIRILSVKVDEALKMIDDGKLVDAKTIIGLQWLALHRASLK